MEDIKKVGIFQFTGRRNFEYLVEKPEYFIGVDTYEKESSTYCIIKRVNGYRDIIQIKSKRTHTLELKKEFDEEVNNLAKYFNATIIKEN